MTTTINNGIPFVPENTIDPAAGLNLSLNVVDALLQLTVVTFGETTPPAGVEGERHIVGVGATGDWLGQDNKMARYLDGAWSFYDSYQTVYDGRIYAFNGSTWVDVGAVAVADHVAEPDPHTQYALEADLGTAAAANLGTAPTEVPTNADLGSAASKDVTTSATDNTSGRVLQVGDFGTGQLTDVYGKSNILGTVSQSSGVPTGAIIERGSNANGEYVKYADGTLLCYTNASAVTSDAGESTWVFPASFSNIPHGLIGSARTSSSNVNSYIRPAQSTTAVNYSGWVANTGVRVGVGFSGLAIGRWY